MAEHFEPKVFGDTVHVLGESPLVDPATQSLWWIDIPAGKVWMQSLELQSPPTCFQASGAVGAIALSEAGGLVVAGETAVYSLDPTSGVFDPIWRPHLPEPGRFNDGRVDKWGYLWLGWLTHARERPGFVWRLGPRGADIILNDLIAPNGIGFSPDGTIAYVTDSHVNEIRVYDITAPDGPLRRTGTLARQPRAEGIFDGLAVDDRGNIWTALYRAGSIVCFSPDGSVLHRFDLPVRQVTSLAFVGSGEIVVTSGYRGFSKSERAAEPGAGQLFKVRCNANGLAEHRFLFG